MIAGILCFDMYDFEQFRRDNRSLDCYSLHELSDLRRLEGKVIDIFIRLHNWQNLHPSLIDVVMAQEKLRGMGKKEAFQSGRAMFNDPFPLHPNARCVTQPSLDVSLRIDSSQLQDSLRRAGEVFNKLSLTSQQAVYNIKDNIDAMMFAAQPIRLRKEDIDLLIDKDGIAGLP